MIDFIFTFIILIVLIIIFKSGQISEKSMPICLLGTYIVLNYTKDVFINLLNLSS